MSIPSLRLLAPLLASLSLAAAAPALAQPGPPPNDECESAIEIPMHGGTLAGTTVGAANDHAPVCDGAGPQTAPGVWYKYRVPEFAIDTMITLCSTVPAWDTRLAVFSHAGCGVLACIAADDDGCPGSGLSFVRVPGRAGEDLLILVHGAAELAGAFTLFVESGDVFQDCNSNGVPDEWELQADPALDCFNPMIIQSPPVAGGPDGVLDACQCPANWSRSGAVDSADISSFITSWLHNIATGHPGADINCSGQTNSADIAAFLTRWIASVQGTTPHDNCP